MKYLLTLTLVLTYSLLVAVGQTTRNITLSYKISDFELYCDEDGYLSIVSENLNFSLDGDTLQPALPYTVCNVLVSNIEDYYSHTSTGKKVRIRSNVAMARNPTEVPTNMASISEPQTSSISYQKAKYPDTEVKFVGVSDCGDYRILSFFVYPFEYDAVNKNLYFREKININISLKTLEVNTLSDGNCSIYSAIKGMIGKSLISTNTVKSLKAPQTIDSTLKLQTQYEYLIVTTEQFKSSFQPLADWKNQKGIRSKIITVEDINATYSGATKMEKIKRAIADVEGVSYVLLGGDTLNVPTCTCYIAYNNNNRYTPVDSYYSCLGTMNWDGNGNGIYGEVDDSISLVPILNVSRIPVSTQEEVQSFVSRIVNYESAPDTTNWKDNILMCGTSLGYNDASGNHHNYYHKNMPVAGDSISDTQCWSETIYRQYIEPHWNGERTRLYDTHTDFNADGNYDFTASHLQTELTKGYTFVDVMTHGGEYLWSMENGYYTWYSANALVNPGYTVITTTACLTNAFDYNSIYNGNPLWSLSRHFILNPQSGVLAYWGTSRENWYSPCTKSLGTGAKYDAQTYQELFSEKFHRMGSATTEAKRAYYAYATSRTSTHRWVWMSLNLLGDPEMPIYLEKPKTFDRVDVAFVNDSIYVNTGVNDFDICFIDMEDSTKYYVARNIEGSAVSFGRLDGCFNYCITKPGYIPIMGICGDSLYIQNNVIAETKIFSAPQVLIGSNVTNAAANGAVVLQSGNTTIKASRGTTIIGDFECKQGATMTITNQ